jgi:hypothetical protein
MLSNVPNLEGPLSMSKSLTLGLEFFVVKSTNVVPPSGITMIGPKKIWGFPVSRPYLAFGCRNPTLNLLFDHACKCFHLEENVCGKWKFEAILGKFMFGCGSTD